jgi:antitoxin PrlF
VPIAQSKLTSQGQISVPAVIRKRLGLGPGSTLEWDEQGDQIVVRKAGKYTFEDVRRKLFPEGPPGRRSLKELKQGIEQYIRERHASGRY